MTTAAMALVLVATRSPAADGKESREAPPKVTAEQLFTYGCVHHYMRAHSVPRFDSSDGYAVEYSDFDGEFIAAVSAAAEAAAAELPPPNYGDPEHGSPAVLAWCERHARSAVRRILDANRPGAGPARPHAPGR